MKRITAQAAYQLLGMINPTTTEVIPALQFSPQTTPPPIGDGSVLQVIDSFAGGSKFVEIPIHLIARGDEFGLGFSLEYPSNLLRFKEAKRGSSAGDASWIASSPTHTRIDPISEEPFESIGVGLQLSSKRRFAVGANEVALIVFEIQPGARNQESVTLKLVDAPTLIEVVDPAANPLSVRTIPGTLIITPPGVEADVWPRPNGNGGVVSIADVVFIGRVAAGLESVGSGPEFQRVDVSPRFKEGVLTRGDGRIDLADWTQAFRYLAALDARTSAGGPISSSALGTLAIQKAAPTSIESRTLALTGSNIQGVLSATVQLTSPGDVNTLGFTIEFDASKIEFESVTMRDISDAQLIVNSNDAAKGLIGIALTSGPGSTFPKGTINLIDIAFSSRVFGEDVLPLRFLDSILPRQVISADTDPLSATFVDGELELTPRVTPQPRLHFKDGTLICSWASIPGKAYQIQSRSSIGEGDWVNFGEPVLASSNQVDVPITIEEATRFFRVLETRAKQGTK